MILNSCIYFRIFETVCIRILELHVGVINQSRLISNSGKTSCDLHVKTVVVCFRIFVLCCGLFSV
jgi:isoprenylcysteine carboxyl methyltransferase (ICMT) family protein YpbQ